MNDDGAHTMTEPQRRLTAIFQQARECVGLLHGIAARCDDSTIREAAIAFLAQVGSLTAGHLVCLASDPERSAEVKAVAAKSDTWPLLHSVWPQDNKTAEGLIPSSIIGSAKTMKPGRASLDTPQTREAVRFVQHMQVAQLALLRSSDNDTAATYIRKHHDVDIPREVIELAASLPPVSKSTLPLWQNALWKYACLRYGGTEVLRKHPDWHRLPNAVKDRNGTTVPESTIRQKLATALAQVLGFTRK